MLPTGTNQISFNQINTELGYTSTAQLSLGTALTTMGEGGNPDQIHECHGYDINNWASQSGKPEGWLQGAAEIFTIVNGSYVDIATTIFNRSQVNSQSGTLYWRLNTSSSSPSSYLNQGNFSLSVAANSGQGSLDRTYDGSISDATQYYMWYSIDYSNWENVPVEYFA